MKKGNKPILAISIIFVVLFLLCASLMFIPGKTQQMSMFYDDEIGIVKYTTTSPSFMDSIRSFFGSIPQIMLSRDYITIGESITISDTSNYPCDEYTISQGGFKVYKNNELLDIITLDVSVCGEMYLEVEYTPASVGNYEVEVLYFANYGQDILDLAKLSFTVKSILHDCEVEWRDWVLYENIDGGVIEQKIGIIYNNPPACDNEAGRNMILRTVCDDGYVIKGEDYQIADGGNVCEKVAVPPEPMECINDMTLMCPDDSVIIIKKCIDGKLIDTGNECEEIEPGIVPGPSFPEIDIKILLIGGGVFILFIIMVVVIIRRFKKDDKNI